MPMRNTWLLFFRPPVPFVQIGQLQRQRGPVCRESTRSRAALGRSSPPFTVRDERIAEEDSTVKGFRKAPEDSTVAQTCSSKTTDFSNCRHVLSDCLLLAFANRRTDVSAQRTVVWARLLFSGERETFSGGPALTRHPANASDILPPSQAPNVVDIIHKFRRFLKPLAF